MSVKAVTHLNFRGDARAALTFYQSVFDGHLAVVTYKDAGNIQDPAEAEQVMWGQVAAENGFRVMAHDVPASQPWDQGEDAFFLAHWAAERRGLERFRTEQPPYSILNRAIEREVLPVCERYGMGTLVWSPLAMGPLTGRHRRGRPSGAHAARMKWVPQHLTDQRKLDAVEQLLVLAEQAGLSLTHMAMAFAATHPGVTAAVIGPRTVAHLDDLLAGATATPDDELLDRIDTIVPPGTDVGPLDVAHVPPSLAQSALRRRQAGERAVVSA
ncbi:aldo/keto reductase [Streptomyces sp. NPDC050264]|uniref:aldo/keto reductase n=1 Tax=Streptomyces sp. NPDC050264 TaxID=3155038 RepID=UPI0034263A73